MIITYKIWIWQNFLYLLVKEVTFFFFIAQEKNIISSCPFFSLVKYCHVTNLSATFVSCNILSFISQYFQHRESESIRKKCSSTSRPPFLESSSRILEGSLGELNFGITSPDILVLVEHIFFLSFFWTGSLSLSLSIPFYHTYSRFHLSFYFPSIESSIYLSLSFSRVFHREPSRRRKRHVLLWNKNVATSNAITRAARAPERGCCARLDGPGV